MSAGSSGVGPGPGPGPGVRPPFSPALRLPNVQLVSDIQEWRDVHADKPNPSCCIIHDLVNDVIGMSTRIGAGIEGNTFVVHWNHGDMSRIFIGYEQMVSFYLQNGDRVWAMYF